MSNNESEADDDDWDPDAPQFTKEESLEILARYDSDMREIERIERDLKSARVCRDVKISEIEAELREITRLEGNAKGHREVLVFNAGLARESLEKINRKQAGENTGM